MAKTAKDEPGPPTTAAGFRAWRLRLGLSVDGAAASLRHTRSMIYAMEAGTRAISPRTALLCWYIERFGPPPDDLE